MAAMADFLTRLGRDRVVPVVQVATPGEAVRLGAVLVEAGFGTAEVALRRPGALAALAAMAGAHPGLLVGAGTVLAPDQVETARAAGAAFAVSPGFHAPLAEAARRAGLPYVPGVATPGEAMAALALGFDLLKVFPAAALGGPGWLKAVGAALGHRGVRWLPTGGIGPEQLPAYLALPEVLACGGTWIAAAELVARGDWNEIGRRAAGALALARAAGGMPPPGAL